MKTNKKGYMLVEIIVSFTLAFAMLYFLMQIIINMKNLNEDYYVETKLEADQLAMTKVVMDDILNKELVSIDNSEENNVLFEFADGTRTKLIYENNVFKYGQLEPGIAEKYIEESLYVKTLDKNLKFEDAYFKNKKYEKDNNTLTVMIPGYTKYSNNNYGVSLDIPYKDGQIQVYESKSVLLAYNGIAKAIKNNGIDIETIKKITISIDSQVGENAWDLGVKKNTVKGWVTTNQEDNSMYDLHINGRRAIYANENSSDLFSNYNNLEEIENLNLLNTEQVTNMNYLFKNSFNLKNLDLSNFDTSKVTTMKRMFNGAGKYTTLDISSFDTRNVTNIEGMFADTPSLETIKFGPNFKTSKVTDFSYMFGNLNNLTSLDVSTWDTSSATDMHLMFSGLHKVEVLDVSKFNTSNVTDMHGMFRSCSSVKEINVKGFNTSKVTSTREMFYYMSSLTSIDVSNFNTENVENMAGMFIGCSNLTTIDVSNFNTKKVKVMGADVTNISPTETGYFNGGMFQQCNKLKEIKFGPLFDTSNVENMNLMFAWDPALETLDLTTFNTSKVTEMKGMFFKTTKMKNIYVSDKWNTSNVTKSDYMFIDDRNLPNYNESTIDKTNAHYNSGGYLTLKQ